MRFIIRHYDDGFSKANRELFGGAPQEAISAVEALRNLGVVELRDHQQVDTRDWQVADTGDGCAIATHPDYPAQTLEAEGFDEYAKQDA
jgi:hypothetical protein